ncbi:MAG: hypothetical protein IJY99_02500 [Alphaproteobacteria bacterium]|nr:hypothetical protein [Alphaproteobacteria bacterium]
MKKIIILSLALPLVACDSAPKSTGPATPADFEVVMNEIQKADRQILAGGEQGDFLIKLEKTDAMKDVASRDKNAKFLSIENPAQYIEKDFCLLNILPQATLEKIGAPDSKCSYRLFCGDTMNYDDSYAVELCAE